MKHIRTLESYFKSHLLGCVEWQRQAREMQLSGESMKTLLLEVGNEDEATETRALFLGEHGPPP